MANPAANGAATPFAGVGERCRMQLRTRSVDEAVAAVEQSYGPHELVLNATRGLDLRFAGFDVGRLSVSQLTYGCPAIGRPQRSNGYWMFSFVAGGESRVGGEPVGTGMVCVRAPGTMTDVPMSADLQLVNLKVDGADLLDAQATLFGHDCGDAPRLHERLAAGSAPARQFVQLLQRLHGLPPCPPRFAALLERRWHEAALFELLLALPRQDDRLPHDIAPRGAVDRALELIDADLAAELALGDLARGAGVGVRALTRGFQRRLGVSPMRYLQQRRLERARGDLLDGRGSVTDVAYRWGFGNLGDFALKYRERFGERPSETLRGARLLPDPRAAASVSQRA